MQTFGDTVSLVLFSFKVGMLKSMSPAGQISFWRHTRQFLCGFWHLPHCCRSMQTQHFPPRHFPPQAYKVLAKLEIGRQVQLGTARQTKKTKTKNLSMYSPLDIMHFSGSSIISKVWLKSLWWEVTQQGALKC